MSYKQSPPQKKVLYETLYMCRRSEKLGINEATAVCDFCYVYQKIHVCNFNLCIFAHTMYTIGKFYPLKINVRRALQGVLLNM